MADGVSSNQGSGLEDRGWEALASRRNARTRFGSGGLRTEGSKGRGRLAKPWRVLTLKPQDSEPRKERRKQTDLYCVSVSRLPQGRKHFRKAGGHVQCC